MDEFSVIANDLSAWEHQAPSHASRSYRAAAVLPTSPALLRLQNELQHLAVLVCVMASAANALENGNDNHSLTAVLTDFCPKHPFDATSKLDELSDFDDVDQVADQLQDFQARLSFAQMLTTHLGTKFAQDAAPKLGDIEILADAWHRTSTSLLSALTNLNAGPLGTEQADNRMLVLGFLKNCIGGGTPCLTAEGQLEIPGWAERRNATRVAVKKTARASTGDSFFEVSILNASTVGLGLTGNAESGQHTTVVFDDGRQVSGTVKWSEDGRFGLQLDQPLAKSDALLASRR